MELFCENSKRLKSRYYFCKQRSIVDIWKGSKCGSGLTVYGKFIIVNEQFFLIADMTSPIILLYLQFVCHSQSHLYLVSYVMEL